MDTVCGLAEPGNRSGCGEVKVRWEGIWGLFCFCG